MDHRGGAVSSRRSASGTYRSSDCLYCCLTNADNDRDKTRICMVICRLYIHTQRSQGQPPCELDTPVSPQHFEVTTMHPPLIPATDGTKGAPHAGIYQYDAFDRAFLAERVAEFRAQVARRLSGELTEEEFKPLRLMNGLYLQLHAYMLRVAIPYGVLSSPQMRRLAFVARTYDRGYGHFTTRQNIQFNWIRLEDAPEIMAALAEVDMHSIQTSGNCIRNVTTDQFAGAAADEIIDPRVYAEILRQWSTNHPEFLYLPRKFKIAITGSRHDRAAVRFHDIGVLARLNEAGEPGFEIHAAGGLGRTPMVGIKVRDWLPEADFLAYMEAILRVYNALGRRDNLYKARLKILAHELGAEAFRDMVEQEFAALPRGAYQLAPSVVAQIRARFAKPPLESLSPVSDVLEQHRHSDPAFALWLSRNTFAHQAPGYACVTLSLKPAGGVPGDATAGQMEAVAQLADDYSFGEIRVAHEQNLVLPHVRLDDLYPLWQALERHGLATANVGLITDIIACPGLDYCTLANARSIPIAQAVADRFQEIRDQHHIGDLQVSISGCINACGHHHVADVGILGVSKKGEEFYQITLGGSSGDEAAVGAIVGPGFPAEAVPTAVEIIVRAYLDLRQEGERFADTYRRTGAAPFKEALYATA